MTMLPRAPLSISFFTAAKAAPDEDPPNIPSVEPELPSFYTKAYVGTATSIMV